MNESLHRTREPFWPVQRDAKRKNVVFAIHAPRDGVSAVFKNTQQRAAYLRGLGHQCSVLTPQDFAFLREFPVRLVPLLYPLAVTGWLARRSTHIDLAIFHSYAGWTTYLLKKIGLLSRLRTVITLHGLEPIYYAQLKKEVDLSLRYRLLHGQLMTRLLRMSCREADTVLCLNREEVNYLLEREWTDQQQVKVIHNPVPTDFFIERAYRPHATNLLFVGQWLPIKGKAYLAEAFTHLVQKHSDLRLSCVGTLASESQVLADFPPEVRPHVTVRSRVTGEELLACHRDADIFVFPTLSEGASLALGEAMATGLPIVTTPVGAAPDLLRHGDSAMFVPIRNPGALVETVERLLDDAALRQSLGSAAQASARYLEPDAVLADYAACLNLLPPSGLPTPSDIGLALTPAAR